MLHNPVWWPNRRHSDDAAEVLTTMVVYLAMLTGIAFALAGWWVPDASVTQAAQDLAAWWNEAGGMP